MGQTKLKKLGRNAMPKRSPSKQDENQNSSPKPKHWVLVGAGPAHLLALKRLSEQANGPFDVTLISEFDDVPLHAMMPEFIGGFYKSHEVYIPVRPTLEKAKARFICDTVTGFDWTKKEVNLKSGDSVAYDFLSINCGTKPKTKNILGAEAFAHLSRPARRYQKDILDFCDSLRGKRKINLVQVGTDGQGAENILSLIRRLRAYGTDTKVHVIESGLRVLPSSSQKASSQMHMELEAHKVQVHVETTVTEVTAKEVVLHDGTRIPSDFTSMSLTLEAAPWLLEQGLETFSRLIKVNQNLETSQKGVFAVGEVAIDCDRPWPRTYQAARKQAKVLVMNIKAQALELPMKKYRPSLATFQTLTNGDGKAMWSGGALGLSFSPFVWSWKAKCDKSFLELFKVKPQPAEESSPPA